MPRRTITETFDSKEEHESYGILGFCRGSGTARGLFGSSIQHCHTIRLTISTASLIREGQKNRHWPEKELIEVEMSYNQFAEAITAMNIGEGVPVTLRRVNGVTKKDPPNPDFRQQAKSELKREMGILSERIKELSTDAKEILESKGPIKATEKKKLLQDLMFLEQEVRSNVPYAHECFQEAVAETITEAKAEIDATMITMREQLGQRVLDGEIKIPLLDQGDDDGMKRGDR